MARGDQICKLQPGPMSVVSGDGSLAEQAKASTLDPLLGIIAGPQPQPNLQPRKEEGQKKALFPGHAGVVTVDVRILNAPAVINGYLLNHMSFALKLGQADPSHGNSFQTELPKRLLCHKSSVLWREFTFEWDCDEIVSIDRRTWPSLCGHT
ncbi:hypothetical protein INR49_026708 [Caranx melampygus]|nr:hypothetical protein INR49_026708 [Caranx melampygus]